MSASDCLKKVKSSVIDEETACDTTLFKLLNLSGTTEKDVPLNFSNILSRITNTAQTASKVSVCLIDLDRISNAKLFLCDEYDMKNDEEKRVIWFLGVVIFLSNANNCSHKNLSYWSPMTNVAWSLVFTFQSDKIY